MSPAFAGVIAKRLADRLTSSVNAVDAATGGPVWTTSALVGAGSTVHAFALPD